MTPDAAVDGEQRELGMPAIREDPRTYALCTELNAAVERARDGYALTEAYWLVPADRLHQLLGIPVLARENEMPVAEQLARQLGSAPADDPLAHLDVAVAERVDPYRVAAVWRMETDHYGSARAPHDPQPVAWNTELGAEPEVRAGWLPPGATGAQVRDRAGIWHDARSGDQVWLCVLPQRSDDRDPPVRYLDVEGQSFERATGSLRALWPRQAGAGPAHASEGGGVLALDGDDWQVFVENGAGREETDFAPLPGSIAGHPHGFGLERLGDGEWRAVAVAVGLHSRGPEHGRATGPSRPRPRRSVAPTVGGARARRAHDPRFLELQFAPFGRLLEGLTRPRMTGKTISLIRSTRSLAISYTSRWLPGDLQLAGELLPERAHRRGRVAAVQASTSRRACSLSLRRRPRASVVLFDDMGTITVYRWSLRSAGLVREVEFDAESAAFALGDVDGVVVAAADLVEDRLAREAGLGGVGEADVAGGAGMKRRQMGSLSLRVRCRPSCLAEGALRAASGGWSGCRR